MSMRTHAWLQEQIRLAALESGVTAYYVGGFVRDQLLQRKSKDIDLLVTDHDAETLLRALAQRCGWAPPVVVGQFGTAQVHGRGFIVEAVRARSESYTPGSRKPSVRPGTLEEDVLRRDFTLNALCLDLDGTLLDLTGRGRADLEQGVLRTPLQPSLTFSEDPLRMLRAARFCAVLGFHVAPETKAGMAAVAARIAIISPERIQEELRRILIADHPRRAFELLRETGVLQQILPELTALVGVEQPASYHRHDVWGHTMEAVERARPKTLLVRLATLLHDVGKPATQTRGDDGEYHFFDHAEVGAAMAKEICRRLRFSSDLSRDVEALVRLHMRPMTYTTATSDKALRRLIAAAGELRVPMLAVARADRLASARPDLPGLQDLAARMHALDTSGQIAAREPVLDGATVMATLHLAPGPAVGAALRALDQALLDGEITRDRDLAIAWLRAHPHPANERAAVAVD